MNIGIALVLLKSYCEPMLDDLDQLCDNGEEKFEMVRNSASDEGNEEIVDICNWVEKMNLVDTFFR